MAEACPVKRWYPVGSLYVNGERVATESAHRPDVLLTPSAQSDAEKQAEFSSLLRENLELRNRLGANEPKEGDK